MTGGSTLALMRAEGLFKTDAGAGERRRGYADVAAVLGVRPAEVPRRPTPEQAEQIRAAAREVRRRRRKNGGRPRDAVTPARLDEFDRLVADQVDLEVQQLRATFRDQVDRAVSVRTAQRVAHLDAREQELQDLEVRLRARLASVVELLSFDEYRLVRSCLHPDRAPPDRQERFAEAFSIFQRFEAAANPMLPVADLRARGWDHISRYRRP